MAQINEWILNYAAKSYANADYSHCTVDCSLGVNLEDLPKDVLQTMHELTEDDLKHYPHDPEFLDCLIEKFAPQAQLRRENFALGCGSVDILFTVNKLFLAPGRTAVGFAPQFASYVDDVHYQGADYLPFVLKPQDGYRLDVNAFAAFIEDCPRAVHAVYVDNPNNPTGQVLTPDELERLILAAARRDAAIIIDEAYGDFMPAEYSAVSFVNRYDHVYVLKTMSKGYGMAGMRLGYLVGCAAGMEQFRKLVPPYNGNGLARQLGIRMLQKGNDNLNGLSEQTAHKNQRLYQLLEGSPIKVAHTERYTPISLLYVEDPSVDLCEIFGKAGIAVVSGASFEGLDVNSVRLMVPREGDMPALLKLTDKVKNNLINGTAG